MIEHSQEKVKEYISFLRQKLLSEGSPLESVYSLDDNTVLEMFRRCCDCDDYLFTKDQELHAILEFDSPERAYEVLYEDHDLGDDEDLDYEDDSIALLIRPGEDVDFDEKLLRAKGILDGAETLDAAIHQADLYLKLLKSYQAQGFELAIPVEDDYGYLIREKQREEEQAEEKSEPNS